MKLEDLIKDKIGKYELGKVKSVVAVSGGPDSMALLFLLAKDLSKDNLCVVHVNHGWRKESVAEEELVRESAQKMGLKFFSTQLKLTKKSEEEARNKRYAFLNEVAQKTSSNYVILAHHADDQLESIILKLIRGTNPLDLWGMDEENGIYLRPLLSVSKAELQDYCQSQKIKYATDASNEDIAFARNRIRQNVVPELKTINPNLLETITSQKKIYEELREYIKKGTYWGETATFKNGTLELKNYLRLPLYMQKAVLRKILTEKLPEHELTQKNIMEVWRVIKTPGNKKTAIGRLKIEKEYDKIRFFSELATSEISTEKATLKLNKLTQFGHFKLILQRGLARPSKNNILLPEKLTYNLYVRGWKSGDKIVTIAGSKKLQDIFSDAKISKVERKSWPVVVSGDEIVWVPLIQAHRDCLKKAMPEAWSVEAKYER